jgi:hypothetical protein
MLSYGSCREKFLPVSIGGDTLFAAGIKVVSTRIVLVRWSKVDRVLFKSSERKITLRIWRRTLKTATWYLTQSGLAELTNKASILILVKIVKQDCTV